MDPLIPIGYGVVALLWGSGIALSQLLSAKRKHGVIDDMVVWFALAWGVSLGLLWPLTMPLLITATVVMTVKGSDRGTL